MTAGEELRVTVKELKTEVGKLHDFVLILTNEQLPERVRRLERWYIRMTAIGGFVLAGGSFAYGALKCAEWISAHVN